MVIRECVAIRVEGLVAPGELCYVARLACVWPGITLQSANFIMCGDLTVSQAYTTDKSSDRL